MAIDLFTGEGEQNEPRDLFKENGLAVQYNNDKAALCFRQGEGPSMFDQVLSFFGDKEKEGAKAVQALVDSEALGISPSDAYRYRDQIDQGIKLNPAAVKASRRTTLTDRVAQSWNIGLKQNRVGELGYKYIMTGDPKYLTDIEKEHLPAEDEIYISEGRIESAVREAAKMLPMMFDTLKESSGKGLGVGLAAGGAAALLGQTGPQVVLPEEIVTVPAATALGFKIGATEGAFESALRKESGLAVADIINFKDGQGNQIDPNLARASSFGIGVINAGIEVSQIKTLLKTVPGLDKIFSKAVMETVTNKTVKQKLLGVAAEYAKTNIKETGQEVAQESTNIVFEELAKQINNAAQGSNIEPTTISDVINRLYDTATASAQAFAVIQLPGATMKAGVSVMPGRKTKAGAIGTAENKNTLVDTPEAQKEKARHNEPFIIGVNDDNGDVSGFTMADPVSGHTFDVPAINMTKDAEGDTVQLAPDPEAVGAELRRAREADIDNKLDQIIQSDIDAETAADEMMGRDRVLAGDEDVPTFEPESEAPAVEKLFDTTDTQDVQYNHEIQNTAGKNNIAESQLPQGAGEISDTNGKDDLRFPEIVHEKTGNYKAVTSTINNEYDLAQLANDNIGSKAQENLIVATTDKKGKILSVYRHTIGDINSAQANPSIIVGQALRNPQVKKIWVAHNHPSGKSALSPEDLRTKDRIQNLLEGTSLELGDFIAVGNEKFTSTFNAGPIPAAEANKKVTVLERTFATKGNQKSIRSSTDAIKFADENDFSGAILLNAQNEPVGIMRGGNFSKIRGPVQEYLLKEIDKRNATGIIVINRNGVVEGVNNLAKFASATSLKLLDVIDKNGSMNEKGTLNTRTDIFFYSGLDITKTVDVLRGLTRNIKEAMPHLEALGSQVYESGKIKFNEWSASMKETLGDMWESFKDVLQAIFDKLKEERGSFSNKDIANQDPLFDVIQYIKDKYQGLNYDLLRKDWSVEDLADLMKKRPGVVTKEGSGQLDVIASEFDMGDNDLMMQLLSRKKKKDIISQTSSKAEVEYLKQIYANETVSREEFNKAVAAARKAFKEGNAAELKKLKNSIKWMAKRKETLKNTRDYFGLTDEEMRKISRKNPLLMDEQEFAQYLKDVNLKAIDFKETQFARAQLIRLIEEKRLQKVDNYRQALELPPISKMTTDQLRQFAKLLEPFQDDDIFLTKRELETVDKTILKGIRTWREAKENLVNEINKKRKSKGLDEIGMADLASVAVKWNDSFKWDSSLREQDPFFDLLVTKMTESQLGADLRYHNIETEIYALAEKAQKSRKRSLSDKALPHDDLVFQYLEAPREEKNAIAQQMTPEELRMAHFIHQYFGDYLNYLISIKALERGRQNYITHIRKSFLESVRDDGISKTLGTDHFWGDLKAQGIRKAVHNVVKEMFARYEEDMMVFNILDDSTGKILPLEKFFQFALHRTGEMQPTKNVVRAFLTYAKMAEKKKAFDAIIPELDIYTQSLTPTKYTPRGLEYDRSLKTFVNKWINNKKGRRISFDSTLRQGGPVDVGIRALRTFTTILDLGLCIPVGIASFVGEQVTNFDMLGVKGQAIGTQRIATDKGKRILEKYQSFVGRSVWEKFTAPGKELPQRLTEGMFGLFHEATRLANKQFLLASMSEEEFNNEELSIERLADIRLEMGKMRVVSGTNSLVGSTSAGNASIQYKSWAVPILRTITHDIGFMINSLSKKQFGESLSSEEFKQLYRLVGLMTVTVIVGSMGGDDEDDSFIGKLKSRAYRESTTLLQGLSPSMWLAAPRIMSWLGYMGKAIQDIILLEEYKTKEGLKGVGEFKKQVTPGVVRQFQSKDEE